MSPKRLAKEDYTVGWICALPVPELQASRLLFDGDEHEDVFIGHDTLYQYVYGDINGHNVVMGCLPASQMGKAFAAAVAAEMAATFPKLKFGLLVGIGGAVPAPNDIRLGDVVVGLPDLSRSHGGLVQYDFGKAIQGAGFVRTGQLNQPHVSLLSGLGKIRSAPRSRRSFVRHLDLYKTDPFWEMPENDQLFSASHKHVKGQDTCAACDSDQIESRHRRPGSDPLVHYGLIASGDQVMKDAERRDALSRQYGGILSFEMEAAGIANILPCLVVRGMCDYCDSHKNKAWQPFAAAAAASWAKELLCNITVTHSPGHGALYQQDHHKTAHDVWMQGFVGQLTTNKRSVDDVRKLIDRISSYEPEKILYRTYRKKLQGTTEWLTGAPAFFEWESSSTNRDVLWLSGKVGSGKTVAMSTAVHHLAFAVQASPDAKMIHHFLQYPDTKATNLFRSLSRQLLQFYIEGNKACPSKLVHNLDMHFGDDNRSPDLDELVDDIMLPLTDGIDTLVVCIDGIDINEEREQQYIWNGIRKLLRRRSDRQKATKILVTAENESKLAVLLPNSTLRIRLDKDVISSDIELYINARLQEHSHPRHLFHDTILREKVRKALLQRAENMFLWVHIQLDEILDCETPAEVDSALQDLPTDLSKLYVRCLKRKSKQRLLCNPKILKWCSAAREPLRVDDLRDMLALDLDSGDVYPNKRPTAHSVIRSGVSLLNLEETDQLLEPAHHSVRQFLFSDFARTYLAAEADFDEGIHQQLSMTLDDAEVEIGQICLCHIRAKTGLEVQTRDTVKAPPVLDLIPRFVQIGLRLGGQRAAPYLPVPRTALSSGTTSLLQFATKTWLLHTKNFMEKTPGWNDFLTIALHPNVSWGLHPWPAPGQTKNSHLRGLLGYAVVHEHRPLLQLLVNKPSLLPKTLYDQVLPGNDLLPALHVAAKLGLVDLISILLKLCSIDGLSPHGHKTALHVALEHGQDQFAASLCAFPGAPVDVLDARGLSPLALALCNCQLVTARALLTDDRVKFEVAKYGLPWKSCFDKSVYLDILCGTRDVNSPDADGNPLLHSAIEEQDFLTVQLLLASQAFADAKDVWGQTALSRAVAKERETIARLLLDAGANVNAKDSNGRTSLHLANNYHPKTKTKVTKLLLEYRADVNARDNDGRTSLHFAASHEGTETLVKLLLDYGADVHAKNAAGSTALHEAARSGSCSVIRLLLEYQANIHAKDIQGSTPLLCAAENSKEEGVVRLLLENHADMHAKDFRGSTPLHGAAASQSNENIVRLLLENAGVNAKDYEGYTPLHSAAAHSTAQNVVKLLVEYQADLQSKDNRGRTPLHVAAAHSGDQNVVKQLLEFQANVNARDHDGSTPVHDAAYNGNEAIVRLLLEKDQAIINSRNPQQETPLHLAAAQGHLYVVEQLLATDTLEVNSRDSDGCTPLHYAASRHWTAVVELLVNTGKAHVDLWDKTDPVGFVKTPSSLVRSGQFEELARLLSNERIDYLIRH